MTNAAASHAASKSAATAGLIATNAPAATATPLPPRKPNHSGYKCPRNAPKPHSATTAGSAPSARASSTGSRPFSQSPASVIAAAFFALAPPVRSTLVAPGLREPCARGSGSASARQVMTALDTEPNK